MMLDSAEDCSCGAVIVTSILIFNKRAVSVTIPVQVYFEPKCKPNTEVNSLKFPFQVSIRFWMMFECLVDDVMSSLLSAAIFVLKPLDNTYGILA